MKTITFNNTLQYTYTLEALFTDALYHQLEPSTKLEQYLWNTYQFSPSTPFGFIGMWLGKTYSEDYLRVKEGLNHFKIDDLDTNRVVICLPLHKLVLCVLYPMVDRRRYPYFQNKVQNEWQLFAPENSVFVAERCIGFHNISSVLNTITSQLDWNLVMGTRALINYGRIKDLYITPLKYPGELDGEVEKALLQKDIHQFTACFEKLWILCRQEIHTPETIKSICVRYATVIAHIARMHDVPHTEVEFTRLLKTIVNAVYWADIWDAILNYAMIMLRVDEKEKEQSLLVIETRRLIQQYYATGISLEEIADKLHVSEEYLSTIFKKETGSTFSETIRTYRINKVKKLLKTSRLKIHDIAQLSGYSDGKYMSRVFKEVVGMSPNEYRKARAD